MNVITIPKRTAQKDDLVIISKMEYENLLRIADTEGDELTVSQKKALIQSRKDLKMGKLLSYKDVARKLGFSN